MGLETPSAGLGRIDPSSLVGQAETIVEPRATAALTDAFHQGVVTADDILARIGELGKSKRKAEIDVAGARSMQAQEATSPEAQAARKSQLALQTQEMEQQKILLQYPAIKYFQELGPAAGIKVPLLPDNSPDLKEMERIGAELAVHKGRQIKAQAERDNIVAHFDDNARIVSAVTKQGRPVDPTRVVELDKILQSSYFPDQPGTFSTPTTSTTSTSPATPAASDVVSPQGPPARPVIEPVGTPVSGGYSLGPVPTEPPKPVPMASEQQKGLAQAAFTKTQIESVADSLAELQQKSPGLSGPVMGRVGTAIKADNWDVARADFTRATTAILANLAKGIYHETGVLSDLDIKRYEKTLPGVNDTPEVAKTKLEGVTRSIFQSIDSNIELMKGQGQVITPLIQGMQEGVREELKKLDAEKATAPATGPATPAATAPRVNTVEEARALPETVQFFMTPDGRTKVNPRYRPAQ